MAVAAFSEDYCVPLTFTFSDTNGVSVNDNLKAVLMKTVGEAGFVALRYSSSLGGRGRGITSSRSSFAT